MSLLIQLYQRLAMRPSLMSLRSSSSFKASASISGIKSCSQANWFAASTQYPRKRDKLRISSLLTKRSNPGWLRPGWRANNLSCWSMRTARFTSASRHGVMRTVVDRYCPCRWYRPRTSTSNWPWTWSTLGCIFARFLQCSGHSHFSVFL